MTYQQHNSPPLTRKFVVVTLVEVKNHPKGAPQQNEDQIDESVEDGAIPAATTTFCNIHRRHKCLKQMAKKITYKPDKRKLFYCILQLLAKFHKHMKEQIKNEILYYPIKYTGIMNQVLHRTNEYGQHCVSISYTGIMNQVLQCINE